MRLDDAAALLAVYGDIDTMQSLSSDMPATVAEAREWVHTKIDLFVVSPLSRTRETAEIVGRPHRLVPVARDGLREISHGRWEGLTRREVEKNFERI